MSQTTTTLSTDQTDPASFTIPASSLDSDRSSGSLESNTSTSTSTSAPSLDTSHSTSSAASAASSTDPSPCPSILIRSNSSLTIPSPSSSASPNVTFAPLPLIDARKRNPYQLGVAARSRLLRHRRMLREHGYNPDDAHNPYGPGNGIAGGKGAADCFEGDGDGPVEVREALAGVDADEEAGVRHYRHRAASDPAEDALVSLGRFVKGAGKTLWRSLSMRDVRQKEKEAGGEGESDLGQEDEEAASQQPVLQERPRGASFSERRLSLPRKKVAHLFDGQDDRPHSEEGGVWEEEIPEESWKRLLSNSDAGPPSSSEQGSSSSTPKTSINLPVRKSIVKAVNAPSAATQHR